MTRMLGLLCAVLAFVGQLSFATIVQADEAQASQIAALQAASIDCHPRPHPATTRRTSITKPIRRCRRPACRSRSRP